MKRVPAASAFMTDEEFENALAFLERSNVSEVTLLGGEPSIHPRFCQMVDRALTRGFHIVIFSGGIIPEKSLRHLEEAPLDRVAVMLNVASPSDAYTQRERDKQALVMRRLGPKLALGLNIEHPTTPLDFLLEWIDTYSLERVVRLGLAHPVVDGNNTYLRPSEYSVVGRRVAEFAVSARDASVQIEFDCGWVPCAFPPDMLATLGLTPQQVGMRCNPILDVLPHNQTICCYPLASLAREPLPLDKDGAWLAARFTQRLASYRSLTLFRHCSSCGWYQRGECVGGCIAGSMQRLRKPPTTLQPS